MILVRLDPQNSHIMQKTVTKSQFKPHALAYFREVEEQGTELIITDRGRPVVRIVRIKTADEEHRNALLGSVLKYENPTESVGLEDWDVFK